MVRITNSMMLRRYGSNINMNTARMDKHGLQVSTFRKFQKGSEDPMSALKALQVRRNLEKMYQETRNLDLAESWISQTEVAAMAVKDCADRAVDLIIQGRNDPMSEEDRVIIANQLKSIQAELLKTLNTQIAGKYLFGGANTKVTPFEVEYEDIDDEVIINITTDENGDLIEEEKTVKPWIYTDQAMLIYNGQNLYEAEDMDDLERIPVYYDLGLGFKLDENDDLADPNSVFDMYIPGTSFIGIGKDNLYNLIGAVADAFKDDNMAAIDGYIAGAVDLPDDVDPDNIESGLFKKLQNAQLNALIGIVTVGENANFINYLTDRNTNSVYLAEVMQNKLEAVEPDKAIMDFKMQEVVYQACLQMGNYILQPSLMAYLK